MTATAAALSYGAKPRVLLIGTSESAKDQENLPPLPHVRNNVDELKRLFCDPDVIGLSSEAVKVLLDVEYASAVTDAISEAAEEARGTLLVYYAGHGLYGDADQPLYLCAKQTSDKGKAANGIPIKTVRKLIAGAAGADRRILILDCCYAGAAFQEGMAEANVTAEVERAIDITGTYGIAAVPGTYKALAPEGEKLTRFTRELVEVLEHGLPNKGNVLTIDEVFEATKKGLNRAAVMALPDREITGEAHRFLFARNRWRPPVDAAKPAEVVDAMSIAIDGLRTTMARYGMILPRIERRLAALEKSLEPQIRFGELRNPGKYCLHLLRTMQDANERIVERAQTGDPVWSRVAASRYNQVCRERVQQAAGPDDTYGAAIRASDDLKLVCDSRWLLGEAIDVLRERLDRLDTIPGPWEEFEHCIRQETTQPDRSPAELASGIERALALGTRAVAWVPSA